MEKAREEGLTKGEARKGKAVARAMLADGMDVNLVSKYTGLTEEEIEALKPTI